MRKFYWIIGCLLLAGCGRTEDNIIRSPIPGALAVPPAQVIVGKANFQDISDGGQSLPLGDDQSLQVPLPFPFTVGGKAFNTVQVCSNGFLSFTSNSTAFANSALPSSLAPDNLLAVYWTDLAPPAGSWVFTATNGAAPNRQFIVMWKNAQSPFNTGKGVTFEAILNETGSVELQYLDTAFNDPLFDNGKNATVGFQTTSALGAQYCFNGLPNALANNLGVVVTP